MEYSGNRKIAITRIYFSPFFILFVFNIILYYFYVFLVNFSYFITKRIFFNMFGCLKWNNQGLFDCANPNTHMAFGGTHLNNSIIFSCIQGQF